MLSPDCKKGNADLKEVDPDEILCVEITQISSSIDYLELIEPTTYKIVLTFLDNELPSERGGVFDMTSRFDKMYHINLSYSLSSNINADLTDICNIPVNIELYKIFDGSKMVLIGQNHIHLADENLSDAQGKLEFLPAVPVLNIKPVYCNYSISFNRSKLEFGVFVNFINISIVSNPNIDDCKFGFLYPDKGEFKKKIFLGIENKLQFTGFINEGSRMLLLECSMNDQCIAIEVKSESNNYLGFLELNQLLAYETSFNQTVPLYEFNWNAIKGKCRYSDSVFKGHQSINSGERKSRKSNKSHTSNNSDGQKKKTKEVIEKNVPPPTPPVLNPVHDEENNQISIEINLSLKYPLIIMASNSDWEESHIVEPQDEQEEDDKLSENEPNDIQSLVLSQNINPQQMKDNFIAIILPLLDKRNILDGADNTDRKSNLITLYFKLKELISDQYMKLVPPPEVNPGDLDKNFLFMAKEFNVFGRSEQSNQFYLRYLKENDFSENALLDYISYNLKIEDFEKARLCLNRLLKLNESNVVGLMVQSYLNFKLNNFILCEKLLLNIFKIAPGFIHNLIILFLLQIKAEKYTQLDWLSCEILKWEKKQIYPVDGFESNEFEFCWTPPNSCDTFFRSAVFFINVGCFAFAEMALAYNQLIQDNLKNDRFYLMSIIDFEQGNYEASLVHLKKYQLSHQTIYKFKFNLLFYLDDFDNFYEFFKNVVDDVLFTLPPIETRQFYLKVALKLISVNKCEEAKSYLDKIPDEFLTYMYWIILGKCFVGLTQWRDAEQCFIKANEIDKLSKEPWIYLNEIYQQLDQKQQAAICLKNCT